MARILPDTTKCEHESTLEPWCAECVGKWKRKAYLADELAAALSEILTPSNNDWFCPKCGYVDGLHITYQEYHIDCGSPVMVGDPAIGRKMAEAALAKYESQRGG